jgi:hypothetical protein
MAKRTTVEEVKTVIDTSLTNTVISNYITSANVFVTDQLVGKGLSDEMLKEIERWLTAHMIASTKERQSKEESAGGAAIKYAGFWGTGLNGTSYGQMAVTLDTSRTLAAISDGKQFAWTKAIPQFDE